MKNIILTLATIAALTLFATPAAAEIDGTPLPTLRSHAEVEDNYIKLGDCSRTCPRKNARSRSPIRRAPAARLSSTRSGSTVSRAATN